MKSILIQLLAAIISLNISAQQCNYLGCASDYGTQNATNQTRINTTNLGCIGRSRQVFWQFVFSLSGGNYTQTFTPAGGNDLDWVVFDIGTLPTGQQTCPISSTGWTQVTCSYVATTGATGPGTDGTVTTVAGHYYAIAVSVYTAGNYTFAVGTPQLNGAGLTAVNCPAGGPLPLHLISFESILNNDNSYSLSWKTESEINTSHFEILASYEGQNWWRVDSIPAKNNGGTNLYGFTSNTTVKGILYVKLKMIDKDGRFTYSPVTVLKSKFKNIQLVSTGLNPVINSLNYIVYASKTTTANLSILDAAGRKLKTEKINLTENNNNISIDVTGLISGIYFVHITDLASETSSITRFLKK
jgi:hypothetical protein